MKQLQLQLQALAVAVVLVVAYLFITNAIDIACWLATHSV